MRSTAVRGRRVLRCTAVSLLCAVPMPRGRLRAPRTCGRRVPAAGRGWVGNENHFRGHCTAPAGLRQGGGPGAGAPGTGDTPGPGSKAGAAACSRNQPKRQVMAVTRRDCRQVVTPGAGPIRWIRAKWATMGSAALAVTVMLISAMLAACTGAGTGPAGGGPAARLDPAQPAPAEADAPEAAGSPACTVSVRTPSGQALRLEVAADPVSRARGLGGRDGLEPGTAMALVFPEPTYVTI